MKRFGKIGRSALLATGIIAGAAGLYTLGNPFVTPVQAGDKAERHPRIRAALAELREARKELVEAKHDFGGHRKEAVEAVDNAIVQLEKALKYDSK